MEIPIREVKSITTGTQLKEWLNSLPKEELEGFIGYIQEDIVVEVHIGKKDHYFCLASGARNPEKVKKDMVIKRPKIDSVEYWKKWAQTKLEEWYKDPKHLYHCIFCGEEGPYKHFNLILLNPLVDTNTSKNIFCCPKCKEYKGLEPFIYY